MNNTKSQVQIVKTEYNKHGEVDKVQYSNGDTASLTYVGNQKSIMLMHGKEDGSITLASLPVLEDKSSTGKVRPWAKKKKNNAILEKIYRGLSSAVGDYYYNKAERLHNCASVLVFNQLEDNSLQHLQLDHMESCRVRLCPMCAWRRTLKIGSHARRIFTYMETDAEYKDKYTYLFLTLTVPNCVGAELTNTIDLLMTAFARLMDKREVKKVVKGFYRGLEVTHNHNAGSKSYDTYHPHFHVILVVEKSYLEQRKPERGYITQQQWKMFWAEALGYFVAKKGRKGAKKLAINKRKKPTVKTGKRRLNMDECKAIIKHHSIKNNGLCEAENMMAINNIPNMRKLFVKDCLTPMDWLTYRNYDSKMLKTSWRLCLQVDIRAVKPKDKNANSDNPLERSGLINSICEVTKYTVKDKDYIIPYDWELSTDIVSVLDDALDRRRLVAWGGILGDIHKKLNLDDEIDGDLTHIEDDNIMSSDDKTMQAWFVWHTGYQQYVLHSIKPKYNPDDDV